MVQLFLVMKSTGKKEQYHEQTNKTMKLNQLLHWMMMNTQWKLLARLVHGLIESVLLQIKEENGNMEEMADVRLDWLLLRDFILLLLERIVEKIVIYIAFILIFR